MKTRYTYKIQGYLAFFPSGHLDINKKIKAYSEKQANYLLAKELSEEHITPKRNRFEYFNYIRKAYKGKHLHITIQ